MTARDAAPDTDPTEAVVTDEVTTDVPARETVDAGTGADPDATTTADPEATTTADPAATTTADPDAGAADGSGTDDDATAAEAGSTRRRGRRRRRGAEDDSTPTATDSDDDGDEDTDDHVTPARRPVSRRTRWVVTALLLVSILFAGAMVGLYAANRPEPIAGLSSGQQAAVDAATQAAINLQTFRRASFDQDFANALASLTPEFAQQQLAPRKDALKTQLTQGGRDASATALSAGLVSSTSTEAVVLVVTNTTQTADDGTSTPFVFSRLQLTLERENGKWLVSDLKSVGLS